MSVTQARNEGPAVTSRPPAGLPPDRPIRYRAMLAATARHAGITSAALLLWWAVTAGLSLPEYLVPSPLRVAETLGQRFGSLTFDLAVTLLEAACGFAMAIGIGVGTAIGFFLLPRAQRYFYSYVIALKTIPIIAIAPLLLIWFGDGLFGKTVMSCLIAYFPIVVNMITGLQNVDSDHYELLRSYGASKWQIFRILNWPASLPYLFAALRVSATLSVIGAIVAEMAGAKHGIGFTILIASYYTDTPLLVAANLLGALGGILFFQLVALAERLVIRWKAPGNVVAT